LSNYLVYNILREAGLPDGVIQFLPGDGAVLGKTLEHPDFAGLHFTGSTGVFNKLWAQIGNNLDKYKSYPRVVGETGGKNFHFVHESADMTHVLHSTIRGAFEYQGQKCSAASRLYTPSSNWESFLKPGLIEAVKSIKMGQPDDFESFMTAVIDAKSFNNIKNYITAAEEDPNCEIIVGGKCDDSKGYFIEPTIIVTTDPNALTMREEIFGPVLTVYVYDNSTNTAVEDVCKLIDSTSPYALTGGIFAKDRNVIQQVSKLLSNSAGNFYINDKSTGAVVGEQPFGGARVSGTNDKAGSSLNLLRWTSARSIKETTLPTLTQFEYPHMSKE
jgi:1-pyrroline-5-carboxylate dehydrogenase